MLQLQTSISREYAGTSALKGDFVRSGRRNWLGQFNDATNSVARYWQNTILDFFKQAMIDYVLGINTNAFLEFSEKMQASDPGEITRLSNIRQAASAFIEKETKGLKLTERTSRSRYGCCCCVSR